MLHLEVDGIYKGRIQLDVIAGGLANSDDALAKTGASFPSALICDGEVHFFSGMKTTWLQMADGEDGYAYCWPAVNKISQAIMMACGDVRLRQRITDYKGKSKLYWHVSG